jgi:uncharacterized protein (UPF0212 family)
VSGQWVRVEAGKHRCEHCGEFVDRAWLWYAKPARHTHCLCLDCTARALKQKEPE